MTQNYFLHASAKEAFKGYVRAYNSHQQKDLFNINTLDLKKVGAILMFFEKYIKKIFLSCSFKSDTLTYILQSLFLEHFSILSL